jgi:excisionase family DNA binding protein
MPRANDRRDWYFVCPACECKFFHKEQAVDCPRCGERLASRERLEPPWRKMLRVGEVAERLCCSISTVYGLIEIGKLGHHRCPGVRVSEDQLAAYLEETRREHGVRTVKSRQPRPHLTFSR